MTYKESEFPQILELILKYINEGLPVNEIFKITYELYKRVPIYIGIVNMCLENVVKKIDKDFKKSDLVIVIDKNKTVQGKVEKIKDNNLFLKNAEVIYKKKFIKLNLKMLEYLK